MFAHSICIRDVSTLNESNGYHGKITFKIIPRIKLFTSPLLEQGRASTMIRIQPMET